MSIPVQHWYFDVRHEQTRRQRKEHSIWHSISRTYVLIVLFIPGSTMKKNICNSTERLSAVRPPTQRKKKKQITPKKRWQKRMENRELVLWPQDHTSLTVLWARELVLWPVATRPVNWSDFAANEVRQFCANKNCFLGSWQETNNKPSSSHK